MPDSDADYDVAKLYEVHEVRESDLGIAVETAKTSVLRRTDAITLLANILKAKDEGPGTGAQLQPEKWVLKKQIITWFPTHDPSREDVKEVLCCVLRGVLLSRGPPPFPLRFHHRILLAENEGN